MIEVGGVGRLKRTAVPPQREAFREGRVGRKISVTEKQRQVIELL